jgi:hypothetical protein
VQGPGRLAPWERLLLTAAAGLAHGRALEMRLAAAALRSLLRPALEPPHGMPAPYGDARLPVGSGTSGSGSLAASSEAGPAGELHAAAERLAAAAARLSFERSVLLVELAGRPAAASCVARGVVLPGSALSALQASLAADFLSAQQREPQPSRAGPPGGRPLRVLLLMGALRAGDLGRGPATAPGEASSAPLAPGQAAAGVDATGEDAETALARRVLALLAPLRVQLLLASGHVHDTTAAAVAQLSGGEVLALGGAGVTAVRAAAAAAGVAPVGALFVPPLPPGGAHEPPPSRVAVTSHGRAHEPPRSAPDACSSSSAAASPGPDAASCNAQRLSRYMAVMRLEALEGGLGLHDYRAASGHARRRAGPRSEGGSHEAAGPLLRLTADSKGGAAAPGFVTVALAQPLTCQLEASVSAFRVGCGVQCPRAECTCLRAVPGLPVRVVAGCGTRLHGVSACVRPC